ncbi:hypothetical protein [Acaryochloris sp. IP29b_bin.137]|uniref:hypothetical protein n=1 Tax=Acaryochloris sp. IP29b_bin.137 TaxID=2969217 RepID=UPI00262958D9|nr:hypothetical protein [Acaryochloris sp. IP29b_bin.137]
MATFLDLLAKYSGWSVVISSIYASQLAPADLRLYVTDKYALEGLTKAAANVETMVNLFV